MREGPRGSPLRQLGRRFYRTPVDAVLSLRRTLPDARVAVAELELLEPVQPPPMDPTVPLTCLLVRAAGHPIGWARLERGRDDDPAEWLGRALVKIAPQLARGAARARMANQPPTQLPPISVIICTRNRTASLARCLESVCRLDYPTFEVIVVDNAPESNATAQLVAGLGFRYAREDVPGLDWARNRGIAEASHPVIAFTDDDVRVDAGWLRGLAAAFEREEVGLVTGFVAPASLDTRAEQLFEQGYGGMGKGFAPRELSPGSARPEELLGTHHLGVGANMAFRRSVLEEIGGFDTALDVGTPTHGGGDLDVFHRVLAAGAEVRYAPSAIVWHHHRQSIAGLRRQMYDNGRAFGAYLLTRLRDRGLPRQAVIRFALHWCLWLLGRIPRRFLRRERMPLPFVLSELWGALHAPWGYIRARSRDRRLRARSGRPRNSSTRAL